MPYTLIIKNVGSEPQVIKVMDGRVRREVKFYNKKDANEAARIVVSMRIDSAFEYVNAVELK